MLTVSYHFSEIRKRSFYIGLSWICCFLLSYFYQVELMYILAKPFLHFQTKFIFIDLTEAFYTTLRICISFSILCLIPHCFYQFWSFYIPSRYIFERIYIQKILRVFLFLSFLELGFIYIIMFPKVCEFLMMFEIKQFHTLFTIEVSARIQSYLSLVFKFFLVSFFLFQIPFLFVFLYNTQTIQCYSLCKNRKIIFVLSLLASSFISPPDVFSQLLLTLLFILIYEFLIFLGFFFLEKN